MKKQLLLITCILAMAACEKDIAPSNPCDTQQETSAAFTIKEATVQQINSPYQVELGEMQTKLLEKVEELTLYILQQQQQIDELKRILAEQQ